MTYRAIRTGWVRGGLGCLMGVPMLGLLGAGAMLLTTDSVAGVLGALLCLLTVVLCVFLLVIGSRRQFVVDDHGITLVRSFSTLRIRWEEIAVIEQDSGYWATGAVVVVLRHPPGTRIIAWPTSDRRALFRGENPVALGDPATVLRPPARAAIDGHRRWLACRSGEPTQR